MKRPLIRDLVHVVIDLPNFVTAPDRTALLYYLGFESLTRQINMEANTFTFSSSLIGAITTEGHESLLLFMEGLRKSPVCSKGCKDRLDVLSETIRLLTHEQWTKEFAGPSYYDLRSAVETLSSTLPGLNTQYILDTIESIKNYHFSLFEWKELHNQLNAILMEFDQFMSQVGEYRRRATIGGPGNWNVLKISWSPLAHRIAVLLKWAGNLQYIDSPFSQKAGGDYEGPFWAVELRDTAARVNELLGDEDITVDGLDDAAREFGSTLKQHMYLTDSSLRNAADELYNFSRIVLGYFGT